MTIQTLLCTKDQGKTGSLAPPFLVKYLSYIRNADRARLNKTKRHITVGEDHVKMVFTLGGGYRHEKRSGKEENESDKIDFVKQKASYLPIRQ